MLGAVIVRAEALFEMKAMILATKAKAQGSQTLNLRFGARYQKRERIHPVCHLMQC